MTPPGPIDVMVADDQQVVRQGIASLVRLQPDMRVVAEAANGEEAITLHRAHRPHVTLMDLRMPIIDGVRAIAQIRRELPDGRFIVLTTYDGDENVYRALQAGAQGYLLKAVSADELFEAIRAVNAGRRRLPPELSSQVLHRFTGAKASPRETGVLRLLARGLSNRQIADELGIAESTVKKHVHVLLSKLGVSARTEAVVMALRRGMVRLD